eukprot:928584-Rhodomonas_salina.1
MIFHILFKGGERDQEDWEGGGRGMVTVGGSAASGCLTENISVSHPRIRSVCLTDKAGMSRISMSRRSGHYTQRLTGLANDDFVFVLRRIRSVCLADKISLSHR